MLVTNPCLQLFPNFATVNTSEGSDKRRMSFNQKSKLETRNIVDLLSNLDELTTLKRLPCHTVEEYVKTFERKLAKFLSNFGANKSKLHSLYLIKNANLASEVFDDISSEISLIKDDENHFQQTKNILLKAEKVVRDRNDELVKALPRELWTMIFSFISTADKATLAKTCSSFRYFINSSPSQRKVSIHFTQLKQEQESFHTFLNCTQLKEIEILQESPLPFAALPANTIKTIIQTQGSLKQLKLEGELRGTTLLLNIHRLENLTSLTIMSSPCNIAGYEVNGIAKLYNLRHLELPQVSEESLCNIFQSLKNLQIVSVLNTTGKIIDILMENSQGLQDLSLNVCIVKTDTIVRALRKCPNLRHLRLRYSATDLTPNNISEILTFPLTTLQIIGYNYAVSGQFLKFILEICPDLENLAIQSIYPDDNSYSSLEGIRNVCNASQSLKSLQVLDLNVHEVEVNGVIYHLLPAEYIMEILRNEYPEISFTFELPEREQVYRDHLKKLFESEVKYKVRYYYV